MPKRTKGQGERGEILDINGEVVRTRKEMIQLARELRSHMTVAEKILWNELRGKKLNDLRFYRQIPIDRYVADFYCPQHKLIIELDGGIHHEKYQQDHDRIRDTSLKERGFSILRIQNKQLHQDLTGVTDKILRNCSEQKQQTTLSPPSVTPRTACSGVERV